MLSAFSQRFQNRFRQGVIPKSLADVDDAVQITRSKNEGPAQLERIFAELVLAVATRFGAFARERVVLAEQVKERRFLQPHSPIGFTLFINKKGKSDSRLLPESAGVIHVSQPNGCEPCSPGFKFLFVLTQLRDVLTAENSTPVAEEHQHCRPVGPERAELDFFPVHIGQNQTRQPAAVGIAHGKTF